MENSLNSSIYIADEDDITIDFKENKLSSAVIFVKDNIKAKIKLLDLSILKTLNISIGQNSKIDLRIVLNDGEINTIFRGLVEKDSSLNVSLVDFNIGNINFFSHIILNGDNSTSVWNLSSLSLNKDIKKYNISFNHIGENTKSLMNNYGVCTGNSTLYFDGISHIEKMAINSIANQKAKIIVFDEGCKAKADPILKIDNREVQANHAAAVGTLNDMHVFYLMSRGISEKETRNLITLGYLKPIFVNYTEEEVRSLEALLEERI
ncbi:MAG: SufD family Fe-S cluster assembly protein [Bacilli bacterium]